MTRVAVSALVLPDRHPPGAFLDDVRLAEQAGVRTVWTYDHLTWPRLRDQAWYGSVPLIAAAAIVTSRVRIGIQVATPNFRHPVPFAKELMTLDQLSAGRLDVGVGAGADGPDASVLGSAPVDWPTRVKRFAEWLTALDLLLRQDVTSFDGEWYKARDARQIPGCVQKPRVPFTVAATGSKGLELAALYGQAWITYGPVGPAVSDQEWFRTLREQSKKLSHALSRLKRSPEDFRRIAQVALEVRWPFVSKDRYVDTVGRLGELGFSEISIHWPRVDGLGAPTRALEFLADAHQPPVGMG